MLLKIVYVLTCRALGLIVVLFRGDRATVAEVSGRAGPASRRPDEDEIEQTEGHG